MSKNLIDITPATYSDEDWSTTRMCFEIKIPQHIAHNRRLSADAMIVAGIVDALSSYYYYMELNNHYLVALSGLPSTIISKGLIDLGSAGLIEQDPNVDHRAIKIKF